MFCSSVNMFYVILHVAYNIFLFYILGLENEQWSVRNVVRFCKIKCTMKMFWLVLALQFIIKLRFPENESTSDIITRRYGRNTWLLIRKWELALRRWEKARLDATFLERCLLYNVTPKFVRFKLYKSSLYKKKFYRDWQNFLLRNELALKNESVNTLYRRLLCS